MKEISKQIQKQINETIREPIDFFAPDDIRTFQKEILRAEPIHTVHVLQRSIVANKGEFYEPSRADFYVPKKETISILAEKGNLNVYIMPNRIYSFSIMFENNKSGFITFTPTFTGEKLSIAIYLNGSKIYGSGTANYVATMITLLPSIGPNLLEIYLYSSTGGTFKLNKFLADYFYNFGIDIIPPMSPFIKEIRTVTYRTPLAPTENILTWEKNLELDLAGYNLYRTPPIDKTSDGFAIFTKNSTEVIGINTNWLKFLEGNPPTLKIPLKILSDRDNVLYDVESITSHTRLILKTPYLGETSPITGEPYTTNYDGWYKRTQPNYTEGKARFTKNSKIVTGSGTQWAMYKLPLRIMKDDEDVFYDIEKIDSNTQITLKRPYIGESTDFVDYTISAIWDYGIEYNNIAVLEPSATSYNDMSVIFGKGYFYRLTAFDLWLNESDKSQIADILAGDTTPPAKPTGLTATGGDWEIRLKWNDNPELDLDYYEIYRLHGVDYEKITQTVGTTYIDRPLPHSTTRYYKIRAVDRNGNKSEFSDVVFATTTPLSLINDQTILNPPILNSLALVTYEDGLYIKLVWTRPTKNTDGSDVVDGLGFEIYNAIKSTEPLLSEYKSVKVILDWDTNEAFLPAPKYNERNWFRIKAIDLFNKKSAFSNALNIVNLDTMPPFQVTGLDGDFTGKDAIIWWNAITKNSDGTDIVDFRDYQIKVYFGTTLLRTVYTNNLKYTYRFEENKLDNAGIPQPVIKFEVRGRDKTGNLSLPATITLTNPPPAPVTNILAFSGIGFVMLRFDPSAETDILHYEIWSKEWITLPSPPHFTLKTTTQNNIISFKEDYAKYFIFKIKVKDVFNQLSIFSAESLTVQSLIIDTIDIKDFAITETKISNASISTPKLQANIIETGHIKANQITGDKIAANTILGHNIFAGTITGREIAGLSITGDKIQANTITGDKIQANTITGDKIQANTITGNHLQVNTIETQNIKTGNITTDLINNQAVNQAKINICKKHISLPDFFDLPLPFNKWYDILVTNINEEGFIYVICSFAFDVQFVSRVYFRLMKDDVQISTVHKHICPNTNAAYFETLIGSGIVTGSCNIKLQVRSNFDQRLYFNFQYASGDDAEIPFTNPTKTIFFYNIPTLL